MEKEEGWIVYPLEDRHVDELVLPRKHVADLRKLSAGKIESTGLLYGVPRENSLYMLGYLMLGQGTRTECRFDEKYLKFYNGFMERARVIQPDLTSILYHNHPLLSPNELPVEVIETLERELKSGIFDYLGDHGINPTIRNAMAEQSRQLSNADIESTFGRLHVLLTDTSRIGDDFSHLNAYKFDPNSLIGTELFKVVPLSEKDEAVHSWCGAVCSS